MAIWYWIQKDSACCSAIENGMTAQKSLVQWMLWWWWNFQQVINLPQFCIITFLGMPGSWCVHHYRCLVCCLHSQARSCLCWFVYMLKSSGHVDLGACALFGVSITLHSGSLSYVFKYYQQLSPLRLFHHELSESVHRLRLPSWIAPSPTPQSWHNQNNWVPFPW